MINFLNPKFTEIFSKLIREEFDALTMTLAALERGLTVHNVSSLRLKNPKANYLVTINNRKLPFQSVSSGKKGIHFFGTVSDRDNIPAYRLARDKLKLKFFLARAKVTCPYGGAASGTDLAVVDTLERAGVRKITVKPLSGTASEGVMLNLTPIQVKSYLKQQGSKPFLIEQTISGTEYRIHVVDGKVAGALRVEQVNVTGDGVSSIQTLIDQEMLRRKQHPFYMHLPFNRLELEYAMQVERLRPMDVPSADRKIYLSKSTMPNNTNRIECLSELPEAVRTSAVNAAAAISATQCGMDIILDQSGNAFVIDIDSPGGIWHHCFPKQVERWNLNVAHAILDMHFGKYTGPIRNVEFFDYIALREAMNDPKKRSSSIDAIDFVRFAD